MTKHRFYTNVANFILSVMHNSWYRSLACCFLGFEWVSVLSSPPASAPEDSQQPPHSRHLPHWEQRPLQRNGAPAPTHGLVSLDRNTAPKFLMFNPAPFYFLRPKQRNDFKREFNCPFTVKPIPNTKISFKT